MSTYPVSSLDAPEQPRPSSRGAFVPLLLLTVAFLGWTIFQTTELIGERSALAQAKTQQTAPLAQAKKIRTGTDSLARKTQELAEAGNANAQVVIAGLRQRGITINPNASASPTPP